LGHIEKFHRYARVVVRVKAQILAFAGPICSGKSVLSKSVAQRLGWDWVSFGDFLRDEALHSGIDPSSRTNLQDLGQTFINKGWASFCQNVLDYAKWDRETNLVVDGVRHVEAVHTLRKLTAPCRFTVIFVETPVAIRKARLEAREPGVSFGAVDSHPVEREGQTELIQLADYMVDGSLTVEEASMSLLHQFSPSAEA
jgi:dephospho-CoA kinase